nr:baseplate J/gp47 family protein [Vibrio sp. 03-59-1]
MSPFWRLVKAIVIAPTLWLIESLLADHVLKNTFAATATGIYLELKAWDVDIERKAATKTRGMITFFKEDAQTPIVIPASTLIETAAIEGVTYRMLTLEEVLIVEGQAFGKVICEAEIAGAGYNLPAGYYSILPLGVTGITHVQNEAEWITTYGADVEGEDELALRVRNQFSAAGRYHIDAIYRSMLASVAGIRTDQIYFEHNAPRGPGTANAYVLLDIGQTPTHLLEQLNAYVMSEGNHGHGDDVLVMALPEVDKQVSVTIWAKPNISDEEKAALLVHVENMVRAAFRESGSYSSVTRTKPQSRFSYSQLATEIHAELIDHLLSLEFDNSDFINELEIPRLTSVSVQYG